MIRALTLGLTALAACATASPQQQGDAAGSSSDGRPGDGPIAQMDAPNGCSTQPCSILPQCGCGTSQTCDVDTSDLMGTACRAVGSGHEADHCTASNCDSGYVCLGSSTDSSCKKYCSSNADCGSPRGQCVIDVVDGSGNPIAGLPPVCSSNCDPTNTAAGGCPANMKCGMYTVTHMGTDYDIADCGLAGTGTQGANCKPGATPDDSLCAPNYLCTTFDGTTYQCHKICSPPGGAANCGALTCFAFNPVLRIPANGTEYGVCN